MNDKGIIARLRPLRGALSAVLKNDQGGPSTRLPGLHAAHEGLSTALILLDHAGETALPGNGLYSLLQPLNQRFQQALMRVNDLI